MKLAKPIDVSTIDVCGFWKRIDKNGPLPPGNEHLGRCWTWLGTMRSDGYGTYVCRKTRYAPHRVSKTLSGFVLSQNLELDHLCANRGCVNPAHLEEVTALVNQARRHSRSTHCVRGHEFSVENTNYRHKRGNDYRVCRACGAENQRKHRSRRDSETASV
jgi:HNH endonuclease